MNLQDVSEISALRANAEIVQNGVTFFVNEFSRLAFLLQGLLDSVEVLVTLRLILHHKRQDNESAKSLFLCSFPFILHIQTTK